MNCPTCGGQMWRTEPGFMRCPNDHVLAVEAVEGVDMKVARVDRPSRRERLQDYLICYFAGATTTAIVAVLVERL